MAASSDWISLQDYLASKPKYTVTPCGDGRVNGKVTLHNFGKREHPFLRYRAKAKFSPNLYFDKDKANEPATDRRDPNIFDPSNSGTLSLQVAGTERQQEEFLANVAAFDRNIFQQFNDMQIVRGGTGTPVLGFLKWCPHNYDNVASVVKSGFVSKMKNTDEPFIEFKLNCPVVGDPDCQPDSDFATATFLIQVAPGTEAFVPIVMPNEIRHSVTLSNQWLAQYIKPNTELEVFFTLTHYRGHGTSKTIGMKLVIKTIAIYKTNNIPKLPAMFLPPSSSVPIDTAVAAATSEEWDAAAVALLDNVVVPKEEEAAQECPEPTATTEEAAPAPDLGAGQQQTEVPQYQEYIDQDQDQDHSDMQVDPRDP